MSNLGQVVANTKSGNAPKAVSKMLPMAEAEKEFAKFKKAGVWPLQEAARRQPARPLLQLREDSGKVVKSI